MSVSPATGPSRALTTVTPGRGSGAVPTRTVDRAMELMGHVCDQGELSLADCARRAGLPPSTALRLLRTLENSGFVSRDPSGIFRPGPRLIQLGAAALSRQSLVTAAEPALRRIVNGCRESAYFCLPGTSDSVVYAGMVEGLHSIRHTSWVGRSIPAQGTAAGAALRGEVGPDGYAVVSSAVEPDVTAIAAPVRRAGGQAGAIAAFSVVGPSYRITLEQAASIGRLVGAAARALSEKITAPEIRRATNTLAVMSG